MGAAAGCFCCCCFFRWLLPVLLVDVGFQIKMKDGKLSGACGNLEIFFLFRVDSMWSLLPHPTPSLTWVSAMKNHCNSNRMHTGAPADCAQQRKQLLLQGRFW